MAGKREISSDGGQHVAKVDARTGPAATRRRDEKLPVRQGILVGAGAFLVNYVTTLMLVIGAVTAYGVDMDDLPATWVVAAWAFLSSQGAGLRGDGEAVSVFAIGEGAVVFGELATFTFALPIVVLFAAGYLLVKYHGATTIEEALKTAVLIVPGYLVLAVVVGYFATWNDPDDVSYALTTSELFLYAGILFPIVFGAIGGLMAVWPRPIDRIIERFE